MTFRSYVPGVTLRKVYSPLSLDVTFISNPVALLVRVSSASPTAAPDGSMTVPPKVALPICACAEIASANDARQSTTKKPKRKIARLTCFRNIVVTSQIGLLARSHKAEFYEGHPHPQPPRCLTAH